MTEDLTKTSSEGPDPRTQTNPSPASDGRWLPVAFGRYRIIRLLGEGGMGAVYEAEQEKPRRKVALKVIKSGMASPEMLRRFEQESQALGRLQHPGIARIYEAGTADTGFGPQPFFAMELIGGQHLQQYADAHHLNVRERLEMMEKICEAVQHAHERGLVHRDLKPGNILVDEAGQPKILDFGVARVTDSDAQATRHTDVGQLVGTLAYMSPEQVLADPLDLDTRSDVYSLGVILYELLAARRPYNLGRTLHEAVQAIREEDPAPLSSVNRRYRGDIETIVATALNKDRARRYASAAEMAGDIRRHLKDEPIVARPPSTAYQLQKFARRHRALVTGVAAVFVVLVGGIIASMWQATRATRAEQAAIQERDRATAAERTATEERDRALIAERAATADRNRAMTAEAEAVQARNRAVTEKDRADTEAATAKAVNEFLQDDLLAQASASVQARPDTPPDPDLKVRTALDRAAARIAGKFDGQPLVEASIRQTIGTTYEDMGLYPEALRQFERTFELRRTALGARHPDTLSSMNELGQLYKNQAKYEQAAALHLKVLEIRRHVLGNEHPDTLSTMYNLGTVYQREGKHGQAEALFTRVLEARRRKLGDGHADTLNTLESLAETHRGQGKYALAEVPYTKLLDARRRTLGEEHPDTLRTMNNLAGLYEQQSRYPQAEALHLKATEVQRRVLGEEHPNTLLGMNNLAIVYYRQQNYVQAEALYTRTLELQRRVLGEEHHDTLITMNNLGALYSVQGKYAEAEPLLTRLLEIQRRIMGEEHPNTLSFMTSLGVMYRNQGKVGQAEPLLSKALETRRRVLGEEHPATLVAMSNLGTLYRDQGKYADSEALFTNVLKVRRTKLAPDHPDITSAVTSLGLARLRQQKYIDAESALREALANHEKTTSDRWEKYNCQNLLGGSLSGQGKHEEAEPLLLSGYQGLLQREGTIPRESRFFMKEAGERIVLLYQAWGKPAKAAEWIQKTSDHAVR